MKNWKEILTAMLFIVFISTPALVMVASNKEKLSLEENRWLAKLPALQPNLPSLLSFPAKFEEYFNDHFGFRSTFVRLYSKILVNVFQTSPKFLVTIGKKDWLFMTGDNEIADFCGYYSPPNEALRSWKQTLVDRRNWLAEQGIYYLFLVPPNKSSVYSEFLPDQIREQRQKSKLEKLQEFLLLPPDFSNTVDLQSVLLEAKRNELVYYKSDTHWNFAGGYAAYIAIIKHLREKFAGFQPVPRNLMVQQTGVLEGGDLSSIINLKHQYFEPKTDILPPPEMSLIPWKEGEFEIQDATENQQPKTGTLRVSGNKYKEMTAIFLCDSFGTALMDFLAMHFKKIIHVNYFHIEDLKDLIQKEKPDIIIHLNVARNMEAALEESKEVSRPMMERLISQATPTLNITAANLANHLLRSENLIIHKDNNLDGILLQAVSEDPQLHLFAEKRFSSDVVTVKCKIQSPNETTFQLFYLKEGDTGFSGKSVYTAPLHRGENTLLFRIFTSIRLDSIRIDPGVARGEYVLRQFTVAESPRNDL